jgi:hypothetical protein
MVPHSRFAKWRGLALPVSYRMKNAHLTLEHPKISERQYRIGHNGPRVLAVLLMMFALMFSREAGAEVAFDKATLELEVGSIERIKLAGGQGTGVRWESSVPQIVQVFQNGFVVGLTPGEARVRLREAGTNEAAVCVVTVKAAHALVVDPATLKQYPDSREFTVGNRKCYGSELNGQRAASLEEKRFTRANRVINPKPLRSDKPLDWEVQSGTEVYDGAGVLMGTVASKLKMGDRRVPVSMFNFGASKILGGRICVYAFSVSITPSPAMAKLLDPSESGNGTVATSAWLPLDRVVEKEALLERIGLGKVKLPALPLEARGYRVTGGNPKLYLTEFGEMSIVRKVETGPVPSHYLRRPSGTINLIYSVPGFGLGGQGTDSFLITDELEFFPAKDAKVFKQPTYFPAKHPQAGKVSPQTMTFLYGAIESKGCEPVYGWIAKEALANTSD